MTAILMPVWQGPPQATSDSLATDRRKPSLRVIPVQSPSANELAPSPSKLATGGLFSPHAHLSPSSPSSPKSPSFKQKMHSRMRSIGGKTPLTPAKKWERLSDNDKATSQKFVKDAVSMCGLAGFSWKKTYEYLLLAQELPLHPDYILNPDEPLSGEDDLSSSRPSSRRPSTSHLTPTVASRPGSATPSTLSVTSSLESVPTDIKQIQTRIRLLFEEMQQRRDAVYMYYVNLPHNNLKKMHAHAVSQHRAAVLRQQRSSLMDAIDFDKQAEKSRGMEMAVAKLRFEMELDVEAAMDDDKAHVSDGILNDVKQAEERDRLAFGIDASIKHSKSVLSFGSGRTSDMRREATDNNRVSGVPTIVTTVSDMIPMHMRHDSMASSIDRPASPASAKSDNPVKGRDLWRRLQDARHRGSKKSPSRVDGVSHPGDAQRTDSNGYFTPRPR